MVLLNVVTPVIWLPLVANVTPIPGTLRWFIFASPIVASLLTPTAEGCALYPRKILLSPEDKFLPASAPKAVL